MPQISLEKNRVSAAGQPSSVDIAPMSDGRIVQRIDCGDVRLHVIMSPEEATMLGVGLVKMSAVVETSKTSRIVRPDATPPPGPLAR